MRAVKICALLATVYILGMIADNYYKSGYTIGFFVGLAAAILHDVIFFHNDTPRKN